MQLEFDNLDLDLKDITLVRKHVKGLMRKFQRRMEKQLPKTPGRVKMQDKIAFMFGTVLAL